MPNLRSDIVDEGVPQVFHCVARCVRRAFLCGVDSYSGRDYEHRRGWVKERLKEISEVFAVEIFAYAVMSNHLHVVLRTDAERAGEWTAEEVVLRWRTIFPEERDEAGKPVLSNGEALMRAAGDTETVAKWRGRLASVSWMMRCLNEKIARRANREDNCKGRFWEGRFRCQRVDDAQALLACMVYVDLNPIRAKVAQTLVDSDFTSVQDRVKAEMARGVLAKAPKRPNAQQQEALASAERVAQQDGWLTTIDQVRLGGKIGARVQGLGTSEERADRSDDLAWDMGLAAYLEMVETAGRWQRGEMKGAIPDGVKPVLDRMGSGVEEWSRMVDGYGSVFHRVAGCAETLAAAAARIGQRWLWGAGGRRMTELRSEGERSGG